MAPNKNSGILYRTEYYDALGDVVAALLMSQIHYWYSPSKNGSSKLRIFRRGKWWVAKSLTEWGAECHITKEQVRRSIRVLESHGLIETESFMMGKSPITHLRFLAVQGKGPIFEVPDLTPFLIKAAPPHVVGNTPPVPDNTPYVPDNTGGVLEHKSITENTQKINQKLLQVASESQDEVQSLTTEKTMAVKVSTKGKGFDSAKAILAKVTNSPKKSLEEYQVSPSGIYYLWANTVPEFHPEMGCMSKFTQKQNGFVNRLVELWTAEDTREILQYVIANWIAFTKYAEANGKAFKSPLMPSIDYVYANGQEAKNFWLNRSLAKDIDISDPPKPKKLTIIKVKASHQPTEPMQPIAPKVVEPEEAPASIETVLAWKSKYAKD